MMPVNEEIFEICPDRLDRKYSPDLSAPAIF